MAEKSRQKAPSGLAAAGRRLWGAVCADYTLEVAELAVLALACRQADDVAALEVAVKADGMMVAGAAGQRRLNAAVGELRQSRATLARLLGQLALPREDERPMTAAQERASRAARARWERTPPTTDRQWKGSRDGAA